MKIKDDRGSVLLFGVGLGVVTLLILTTAINIAALWVTRTKLDSIADATALAATRSIDVLQIYETGVLDHIKLDGNQARQQALNYLNRLGNDSEVVMLRLESLEVSGNSVSLRLSASAQLPFGYLLPGLSSTVISQAKAQVRTG